MKVVRRGALPVGGDSGLAEIASARQTPASAPSSAAGRPREDIWPGFVDKVLSFIDAEAIRPLRVVIDAANGMAGVMLPPVLERLPQIEFVRCYFEPDGPSRTMSRTRCSRRTASSSSRRRRDEGADLGIAFDGDADRCFFVDDTRRVRPRRLRDCAARRGDAREGARREGHLRRSRQLGRAADDRARRAACRSMNRVGHAFIKQRMREEDAVFGGEVSAHYYFRDFSQADTGASRSSLMLELLSRSGRSSRSSSRRSASGTSSPARSTRPSTTSQLKLQQLEERYGAEGARITHLDGVSVDFDDWHFNVRPSNTEPLLRLTSRRSPSRMEGSGTRCWS